MNSSGKMERIRHKERKNRRDYSQYEMHNFYFDRSLQKTEVTKSNTTSKKKLIRTKTTSNRKGYKNERKI
jgi:hypothetical protein